jgi:ATP-dependent DNA helicase RecG
VDLLHADEVPTRCGLDVLDHKLFSKFLQDAYQETLPKTVAAKLKLLENMNLATNGQLNLAGLLLFGEKPHIYKPEFIYCAEKPGHS